ncbi:type VI secretion system baseplate subunit TssF [Paraburkholderia tagetis]|uniref:Type VI secretion system baseplate subunit TssF n=1 Tax=Paraburkholderia tagetis TaxID=2913261 RepID=A0A9X1UJA3_9BURK|nr:type VI secretion system baseplate subunit TssF [Paraburkholderia tagetis]MCG5076763.1 type VI secretion system baseplate subunit TssF [Paraburkholderia tagetis]
MDTRFLDYYNRELAYLRELGAEFARQYPKVAGGLGMHGIDVADPFVERLLEGFCFLTARVQLKMDAEFPRFSERLLDVVYPDHLAPTPAMAIVQFEADPAQSTPGQGFTVPAGTSLMAAAPRGMGTACEFRTAQPVTLWPLVLRAVDLVPVPAGLAPIAAQVGANTGANTGAGTGTGTRRALRIVLGARGGASLNRLPIDQLTFFLSGPERQAMRLLELVCARTFGVVLRDTDVGSDVANDVTPISGNASKRTEGRRLATLGPESVVHEGFDADQALFPPSSRGFEGYRILREHFAFAARNLFFSVRGLRQAFEASRGECIELLLLIDGDDADLERSIDATHLALDCTPAINLFPKRTERIPVTPGTSEYRLMVDRTRALDYEIFAVKRVIGHRAGAAGHTGAQGAHGAQGMQGDCAFHPLYMARADDAEESGAYFSVRRETRLVGTQARRSGLRSNYAGTDVYVSLVDRRRAPFDEHIELLSADTLCTNRDLPLHLAAAGVADLTLKISAPVSRVRIVRGPSAPRPPLAQDEANWRLIAHLGLNYQPLADIDDEAGAQRLREQLEIYADPSDAPLARRIRGIRRLACEPVFRRLPVAGPLVYGRGVRVELTVDDHAFAGDSPYVLGAALEQFFARHASINAFVEFALYSAQRGEVAEWPARVGRRPAI